MKMRILLVMIVMLGLSGCVGTVKYKIGNEFDPAMLERGLKTGVSTRANVKALLGKPYGIGKTMMPFHDSPRTVWTYFYELADLDLAGGANSRDHRTYLFLYFKGDKYDGYMWFDSQMQ